MSITRWPRTDVGTVALHWVVVAATLVLVLTGLRFSSDDVHHLWLRDLDGLWWSENLWQRHLIAGYVLSVAAVAYAIYLPEARLFDRIRLNATRWKGLFDTPQMRWSTVNVLLVWAFLIAAVLACLTGWLAYLGVAGPVLQVHRLCTWVILAFPLLHLLALLRLGGVPHLLRILRPRRTEAVTEDIDLASVVADLLAERQVTQVAARRKAVKAAKRTAKRAAKRDAAPGPHQAD